MKIFIEFKCTDGEPNFRLELKKYINDAIMGASGIDDNTEFSHLVFKVTDGEKAIAAEADYQDFWRAVIELPNGTINHEVLRQVLYEYTELRDEISSVYYNITCGQISKPHTNARVVIEYAEEHYGGLIEDPVIYTEYLENRGEFLEWLNRDRD